MTKYSVRNVANAIITFNYFLLMIYTSCQPFKVIVLR